MYYKGTRIPRAAVMVVLEAEDHPRHAIAIKGFPASTAWREDRHSDSTTFGVQEWTSKEFFVDIYHVRQPTPGEWVNGAGRWRVACINASLSDFDFPQKKRSLL